ncbi:THUMP-like domain-containing protein [Ulvibacter litoralis]|uniref:Uncharacterized protein n=1 Tax=Ulvibacter litoralis TaxID=227084 RepID=A0A1G7FRI5_9FLAO|nr:SAM-dependent methyltransferase [Ulvibacter litoralis]GHC50063.1 hypothetical protein GCM10008083_11900 [Ulvibacter litoralis]SDE78432.1 hypothetical protein SAMN05421855_102723 [Ulvibacter litoralis]
MDKNILNTTIQHFIKNYTEPISQLAFKGSPFSEVTTQALIQQIESYQKSKDKLPTWHKSDGIYYPPKLNLEQTSSEVTAKYKASIVSGKTLADITGGFGVDCFYFAKKFSNVYHFEHNEVLSEIAAHNFKVLRADNILCEAGDGLEKVLNTKFDVIYTDPSRRHDSKGKVFFLKDCEPNIPENLSEVLKNCDTLLLKTSPMLDISAGLDELTGVYQIHVVAVENEVKELLWLLKQGFEGAPEVKTINFAKTSSETFHFSMNASETTSYGIPQGFLYEPNAAIMKSGAFQHLSEAFTVNKLHKHTHLYTSETLQPFPGRSFSIEKIIPYGKKTIRKELALKKANITTRNFPESVASLRKKWNIKDGGEDYLFFTTLLNDEKVILVCKKVEIKDQ